MRPSPSSSKTDGTPEDWWGKFHLHAFLNLTWADNKVERRELVWIKRFFERHGRDRCYDQLCEHIESRDVARSQLDRLLPIANARMSPSDKRRFTYNLAQLCKSKGAISTEEYESILDIAGQLGVRDTESDAIINSVFSINDTFVAIIGIFALGAILYFMRAMFVPLVIAIFVTMIVNKVAATLRRLPGLTRFDTVAKLLAMVLVIVIMTAMVLAAVQSGKDISTRLPYYQAKLAGTLDVMQMQAEAWGLEWPDRSRLSEHLRKLPVGSTIGELLGSVVNIIGNLVLILIFTGFLALSTDTYEGILQEMNEKIAAYITVKSFVSALTGVVVFFLCWAFGIDFALFWAVLVVLLNYIPAVGSIAASVPPIVLAMLQLESMATVAAFAVLLTATHMLIGQVLEPKLMGDRLAVKPVAILLGLIFWGFLWGLPGMFLAAPLMAFLRILSSYFNFSRDFEQMLAAN